MFEWTIKGRRLYIRAAQSEAQYHAVEDIQREVWGFSDLDVVPMATLIATQWAGGMLLCAYEGEEMIGFVYGFAGHEHGRSTIHSHMLAVKPAWRNLHAGYYLKLAQRSYALEKGIQEITWTFDPLQSLNAHLNFTKLGVVSRQYIVNFYGEASSSPLHQGFGTDRLWVRWLIDSERVKSRLPIEDNQASASGSTQSLASLEEAGAALLVRCRRERPELSDLKKGLSGNRCLIEIPHNITALKQRDPALGVAWREATRAAFLPALEAGFLVEDLLQLNGGSPAWLYLLTR